MGLTERWAGEWVEMDRQTGKEGVTNGDGGIWTDELMGGWMIASICLQMNELTNGKWRDDYERQTGRCMYGWMSGQTTEFWRETRRMAGRVRKECENSYVPTE